MAHCLVDSVVGAWKWMDKLVSNCHWTFSFLTIMESLAQRNGLLHGKTDGGGMGGFVYDISLLLRHVFGHSSVVYFTILNDYPLKLCTFYNAMYAVSLLCLKLCRYMLSYNVQSTLQMERLAKVSFTAQVSGRTYAVPRIGLGWR